MPKIRTNRCAAKRFKKTAKGKLSRRHAFTSHLLSGKSPKRKRKLRKSAILKPGDTRKIKRLIANF